MSSDCRTGIKEKATACLCHSSKAEFNQSRQGGFNQEQGESNVATIEQKKVAPPALTRLVIYRVRLTYSLDDLAGSLCPSFHHLQAIQYA